MKTLKDLEQNLEDNVKFAFDHVKKSQSKGGYPSQGAEYSCIISAIMNSSCSALRRAKEYGLKLNLREDLKRNLFEAIQSIGDVYSAKELEEVGILPPEGMKIEAPECKPGIYLCKVDHGMNNPGLALIVVESKDEMPKLGWSYIPLADGKASLKKALGDIPDEEVNSIYEHKLRYLVRGAEFCLSSFKDLELKFELPADKRIAYCVVSSGGPYIEILGKAPGSIRSEIKRRLPKYEKRIK